MIIIQPDKNREVRHPSTFAKGETFTVLGGFYLVTDNRLCVDLKMGHLTRLDTFGVGVRAVPADFELTLRT